MFRIHFEQVGGPDGEAARIDFPLEAGESVTVGDLIRRAVVREIEVRELKVGKAGIQARQNEALDGFRRGLFAVLVEGEPLEDLEQWVPADARDITFIRVLPLVGG
ncbi:hypothetical protein OKA05_20675 [Luteolibacter arcticus]|uniref:MoaD/ThiS family protein n=1 Tax=Luteolibacter arcticus TaxID=1581411 RepID=A0ABT3GN99_9BACT|nr:hypothetical protein [Luteolibacter arcticus]MCW1924990.1 hypothetical protein [Luteolibacter arcticus]